MTKKSIIKFMLVAALLFGSLISLSCDKWDALKTGHVVFGTTLNIAESKIGQYCNDGRIEQKDCEELHIRLGNIKSLHISAGKILDSVEKIEGAGLEAATDEYVELFTRSMEALENLYDFTKLCGLNLEIMK